MKTNKQRIADIILNEEIKTFAEKRGMSEDMVKYMITAILQDTKEHTSLNEYFDDLLATTRSARNSIQSRLMLCFAKANELMNQK